MIYVAKVRCSARIENDQERSNIMSWIRTISASGYSEIGDTVYISFTENPANPESSSIMWGIIHTFEQYPVHSIDIA